MIRQLTITAVVENTTSKFDMLGEWGLSLWIEADGHRVVYDTGQGKTLLSNARLLGIDLAGAGAMVLSHGHSDHSAGIAALVNAGFRGKVFANPAALATKYQREGNSPPRIKGMPTECINLLRQDHLLVDSSRPTQLAEGMIVTGQIPRHTSFEDTGGAFFLDESCTLPDFLLDDQALLIETALGWVIITGCGHSGAVNILEYAVQLTGKSRIYGLLGGLHLLQASPERLSATARALQRFDVQLIAPCHCTGPAATSFLKHQLGARVVDFRAGATLRVPASA